MYSELHRLLILLILLESRGGWSLRLARLVVPQYKMRGEIAILQCNYELEGDILYSVKWYKENEEFYRFVPKSNPTQVSYKVEGIKVDHLLSNSRQVVLRSVNLKSSGVYKCEVSAEAPSFSSESKEAKMEVLFLPNNGPHIKGLLKEYVIGDEISLNCTSSKSYPAALLHWYINDKLITDSDALEKYPNIDHPHGLKTSILGLKIIVNPQRFSQGIMRLRCVASLSPILWQGNKESIVQSMAPHFLDKEALILVRGKAWKITSNLILMLTILLIFFT